MQESVQEELGGKVRDLAQVHVKGDGSLNQGVCSGTGGSGLQHALR